MDDFIFGFLCSLLEGLLYAGLLAALIVQYRRGALWIRKFSVLVSGGFAGTKVLTEFTCATLYLLLQIRGGEHLLDILTIVSDIRNALAEIFLFATSLLCLIYLGKVKRRKK